MQTAAALALLVLSGSASRGSPAVPAALGGSAEDPRPGSPPASEPRTSEARLAAAREARSAGDSELARTLIAEAIDVALADPVDSPDEESRRHWAELEKLADELGALRPARSIRERVLEACTRTLPDDHPELVQAKAHLSTTMFDLGDIAGARVLDEQVLEARLRTLPADHPDVQRARGNLAGTVMALGDLKRARVLLEQVLEVRERTLDADHIDVQVARMNLGVVLHGLMDFTAASDRFQEALDVLERTLPDDDPNVLSARSGVAAVSLSLRDPVRAQALLVKILEVQSRTLPAEHPAVLQTRSNLSVALKEMGDLVGAREQVEQILVARVRLLPDDHPELQGTRQNLASVLLELGRPSEARVLAEKVLAVYSRTLPDDHPSVQSARLILAVCAKELGDFPGARVLEEQALAVLSRDLPEDHVDVLDCLQNLGITLVRLDDLPAARSIAERILAVRAQSFPEDHPEVQAARTNLASILKELGELPAARSHFDAVLQQRASKLDADHPDLQSARMNVAITALALGEASEARALFEQVVEVLERTLPEQHEDVGRAREYAATSLAIELTLRTDVDRDKARALCAKRVDDAARAHVRSFLDALASRSPREAEEISFAGRITLDRVLTFSLGYGALGPVRELESTAFTLSETTRGASVRWARWQRRASGSAEFDALRARVRAASDALARLFRSGASREAFQAARAEREASQRALSSLASERVGSAGAERPMTSADVARVLDADAAVVAYRRFVRDDVVVPDDGADAAAVRPEYPKSEHLCAFVVRRTEGETSHALTVVDLGPLADVEREVTAWRATLGVDGGRGLATSDAEGVASDSESAGRAVRRLLLDPLAAALGDARRIVVVHDDVTHLVPLDALPDEQGGLVGLRRRIEVRSTLAEILEAEDRPVGAGVALALGDARFGAEPSAFGDAPEAESHAAAAHSAPVASLLRGTAWSSGFADLSHTGPEARGVAELWTRIAADEHAAIVLSGAAASRDSLVQLAPSARWLHVATHGWHAPESVASFEDPERAVTGGVDAVRASAQQVVQAMSPMLLCGLALAGANLPEDPTGRAPGLLTAEEMSALDLSNCELAVLSACDTNVGIRRAGQGVASFQRALQMAGARSVITSQWKVPDEATHDLMLDVYRRIWVEGQPRSKALWEAKMAVRNKRDERGAPRYSTRDWAAWVLTGEPDGSGS